MMKSQDVVVLLKLVSLEDGEQEIGQQDRGQCFNQAQS